MAASQSQLLDLLGQSIKTTAVEFWNTLDHALTRNAPITGRLTAKAKQKLVDIFRHSVTSTNPQFTIHVVITLMQRMAQSPEFIENFGRNEPIFYSTFTSFVSRVMSKPSEGEYVKLKTDLLVTLEGLYREPSVLREETAKGVLITIIPMLKNVNDVQNPVIVSVAFIHKMIQNIDALKSVIVANAALFIAAFESCQSPRLQMQILTIMWFCQLKTTKFSLAHDQDADFVEVVHRAIAPINDGVGMGILTLPIQSIDFPTGEVTGHAWADFGMADVVLYYADTIMPVSFEFIQGLNMSGSDALAIELDRSFPGMGEGSSVVTLRFESSLSPDQVNLIFARISQGESQPQNMSDAAAEVDSQPAHGSFIGTRDSSQPRPKSSIAVFHFPDAQTTQTIPADPGIFAESGVISDDEPEELPPPFIQDAVSAASSPALAAPPSPPPPTIAAEQEQPSESLRHRQPVEYHPDRDDALRGQSALIAEKLSAGIEALTRSRLDGVNRFGGTIAVSVDTLKEDIRTTMRDREHGSMKQLEASKDMFQGNIQQFKRKAASMHQTLVGFEHETQAMSAKITEIQRMVRKEIQQRRIDLENELKKLRKLVRSHNRGSDSEPSDDDALDIRT
jgi:hypothetical protein